MTGDGGRGGHRGTDQVGASARALAALDSHLPKANVEISVAFKKPVRLPSEVILLSSAAGSSGDFQLNGHGDLVHMTGNWRPIS